MATQFTPCPACGAVGEVGSNCQFCGTTIILKEGATFSDTRVMKQRTITPQQYAEKISIYHNIEGLCEGTLKVSIGGQEGIINLNGDLIYPLGNERITKGFQEGIVKIGEKYLNLENFEYVEDPYLNKIVLEKIKKLSNEIANNPLTDGIISLGLNHDKTQSLGLNIFNASYVSDIYYAIFDDDIEISPELMFVMNCNGNNTSEQIKRYNRFASCSDFELFRPLSTEDSEGEPIPDYARSYAIFLGHDAENCCKTSLRVLHQVYGIHPNDVSDDDLLCFGDIFVGNISKSPQSSNSSNSGCAGMLALMLGIGGVSVYGIVELISRLIA